MVCMSSNAEAARVIRAGARIAARLGARWYAVYVETPREAPGHIQPADRDALARNIALAESLGATVVRVKADKPGDGLIAFANREGITHVIFGQTRAEPVGDPLEGLDVEPISRGGSRCRGTGRPLPRQRVVHPRCDHLCVLMYWVAKVMSAGLLSPIASPSALAFSIGHLSCSARLIIHMPPTRFAEPQWMNTG